MVLNERASERKPMASSVRRGALLVLVASLWIAVATGLCVREARPVRREHMTKMAMSTSPHDRAYSSKKQITFLTGPGDHDPYTLAKVRQGPAGPHHLRLTMKRGDDENLQIWGGPGRYGAMSHKLDVQGNARHGNDVTAKALCVSADPLVDGAPTSCLSVSDRGDGLLSAKGVEFKTGDPSNDSYTLELKSRGPDRNHLRLTMTDNIHEYFDIWGSPAEGMEPRSAHTFGARGIARHSYALCIGPPHDAVCIRKHELAALKALVSAGPSQASAS